MAGTESDRTTGTERDRTTAGRHRVPVQRLDTEAPAAPPVDDVLQGGLRVLADHWGLVLAYGVITACLGIAMLVWPGATLVVAATLFAAFLIANGVFQVIAAFSSTAVSGGIRAMLGLLGALSFLVGLLCLRRPLQTMVVIALVVGAWWLVSGVVETVAAIAGGTAPHRGWRIAMGLVSIVAGVLVLMYPGISLATFLLVAGIWLILYGAIAVVSAFRVRSASNALRTRFSETG
jgi:uncharacterized membrane protein HdeD (DUF308 family)